jgi:hypothetical protein
MGPNRQFHRDERSDEAPHAPTGAPLAPRIASLLAIATRSLGLAMTTARQTNSRTG